MALVLNILIPGAGLILKRREWLGLSLAVLFALCANAAIAGIVIAPAAIPRWLAILTASLAIGVWVVAQVLCRRQSRHLREAAAHVRALLNEAASALERHDPEAARLACEGILALDPECAALPKLQHLLRESAPAVADVVD